MKFEIADAVDAEFVEVPRQQVIQPQTVNLHVPSASARNVIDMSLDLGGPSPELALYEKRGRAVALFIRLPLLAFVALNDRTPGLIRIGAGLLAVWEATQLARGGADELDSVATEWMGQ